MSFNNNFSLFKRKKDKPKPVEVFNQESVSNENLIGNIEEDVQTLKSIFNGSSDVIFCEFYIGNKTKATIILLDGLVNTELIDSNVIHPLLDKKLNSLELNEIQKEISFHTIPVSEVNSLRQINQIVHRILSGETILLVDTMNEAINISSKKWEKRSVEEPNTEAVIRGPRDGFTEDIRTNTALIRRRIKSPLLKMDSLKVGRLSDTEIVITYLEGVADPKIIQQVYERMNSIDIDAILESGYIEELIEDRPSSIFPQIGNTERPDKLTAAILEGHIGILVDNTPFSLIAPQTFFQMIQSSEDYYQRYIPASLIRLIRFLGLHIALFLPAVYVALTTYHQEMIPTSLLLSMASSREVVPFPAIVEVLIMEISFEMLREAGLRLPKAVGQAVSIVGALVIGQAAVEAGIVSTPMVIIVALTGISTFVIPAYNQSLALRIMRFPLIFLAGTLGLFGVFLGLLAMLIHMCGLNSFGVPYLSPWAPIEVKALKDLFIRSPRWSLLNRPDFISNGGQRQIRRTKIKKK